MYSFKPPRPHPLNSQNLLSITKVFGRYTVLNDATNYKNGSNRYVSKHYRLAIYLANTKYFCGNSICSFLRWHEFSKTYSINIDARVSNFLIYDQKKVIIKLGNISRIFLKTQRLDLKWWLITAPGGWNSSKRQHEKLVASNTILINYMYIISTKEVAVYKT